MGGQEAAAGRVSAAQSDNPSASSSRMVVARVNGRRPDSAFSRVEMLILASSASRWREIRRRAIASRMAAAITRLCSSDKSLSATDIIEPLRGTIPARLRT